MLASIYIDRRDAPRAINLLEPFLTSEANDPQLLSLLGAAYMAEQKYHIATPLLERAVKLSGGSPDIRSELGISLIGSGHVSVGFDQIEKAFAKDPGQPNAGVALAAMYASRGQWKKALDVIDAVVKRNPRNLHAINVQGAIRVAAGDRVGGRASYERVLALAPDYRAAQLNLARLDLAEGKPDAARRRLLELVKIAPRHVEALMELARREEVTGHPLQAVAWLEKAREIPAQRIRSGIALVDLLLRQRQAQRAVNVARDVVSREPKSVPALRALARAELVAGDNRSARQTLSVIGPLVGFDPRSNIELAQLQFAAGDQAAAAHSLERARGGKADYLPALILTAEMQIAGGDFAKAEQQARRIVERFPASGAGPRLLGVIAEARGQPAAAITNYRAALEKENSTDTALSLYRAYANSGDAAKGLSFLVQWCRDNPDDMLALRALADGRLRRGELPEARASYERLLQRLPEDAQVLNNLAQVAIRQGDKAALEYAERAYKLSGQNAAIVDTLGWTLVQQGQLERGIGLLRDARLRDSSSPDIRYHLAAALAQAGREAEARTELREALKSGGTFEEIDAARKLQRTLGP